MLWVGGRSMGRGRGGIKVRAVGRGRSIGRGAGLKLCGLRAGGRRAGVQWGTGRNQ